MNFGYLKQFTLTRHTLFGHASTGIGVAALPERQTYQKDPLAANRFLTVGDSRYRQKIDKSESAAWTTVASVILNLDETVTKA